MGHNKQEKILKICTLFFGKLVNFSFFQGLTGGPDFAYSTIKKWTLWKFRKAKKIYRTLTGLSCGNNAQHNGVEKVRITAHSAVCTIGDSQGRELNQQRLSSRLTSTGMSTENEGICLKNSNNPAYRVKINFLHILSFILISTAVIIKIL